MPMTDDEIIRARLLVDERPLKRLIKKFYALAACPLQDIDSSYAQFILELDSQDVLAGAKSKTSGNAREEIASYEREIDRIQAETRESEQEIVALKAQLALAQQTRKNKIVYDGIAKEALKIPSRAHSAENVARLTAELRDLEAEQKGYAETWTARQAAFDAIVQSLEDLGERVREEKSEQERRQALNDDDVPDGNAQAASENASAEESEAEGATGGKRNNLDPAAKAFEPSPLRHDLADGSGAGDASMEVDEDGEVQPSGERDGEEDAGGRQGRSRSRSTAGTKEEGEEEEENMQT